MRQLENQIVLQYHTLVKNTHTHTYIYMQFGQIWEYYNNYFTRTYNHKHVKACIKLCPQIKWSRMLSIQESKEKAKFKQ